MAYLDRDCSHLNEILCAREGDIVCLDCGLVKDTFYDNNLSHVQNFFQESYYEDYIKDLFNKLNLPYIHIEEILFQFKKSNPKTNKIPALLCIILEILNKYEIPICIKDISDQTEFSPEEIFKQEKIDSKIILPIKETMEKYCKLLNLKYNDFLSIYEFYKNHKKTGHQPLTIVASFIYHYVNQKGIGLKLDTICKVMQISKISVIRFCKKELLLLKKD